MKINRHLLHSLLINYKDSSFSNGMLSFLSSRFFSQKTKIRQLIEKIRIDLSQHEQEQYARFYADLNEEEKNELIEGLNEFIASNTVSDMRLIDNRLIHELFCTGLLAKELDQGQDDDKYCLTIDSYFKKLQSELSATYGHFNGENLSSVEIWLRHVTEFPELYLHHILIDGHANSYRFPLLDLVECGCSDMSHDRLIGDVRHDIEEKAIKQCQAMTKNDKNVPIKILSMGPGKGLQEFILIFKLLNLGISNIELTLIEPDYKDLLNPRMRTVQIYSEDWEPHCKLPEKYYKSNQSALYAIIRALTLLSRNFFNSTLQVYQYDSVEMYKSDQLNNDKVDLIYAIDFEDYQESQSKAYQDFHALADRLDPNGLALVSYHYYFKQFEIDSQKDSISFKELESKEYQRVQMIENQGYLLKQQMSNFFK